MSDHCSKSNPCNFPVASAGAEPSFQIAELLLVTALLSVPTILVTLFLAISASKRSEFTSFWALNSAWLVPPSVLAGFLLIQDFASHEAGSVLDFLFRGDGKRELIPLFFLLVLASLVTAFIVYLRVRSRAPLNDLFE